MNTRVHSPSKNPRSADKFPGPLDLIYEPANTPQLVDRAASILADSDACIFARGTNLVCPTQLGADHRAANPDGHRRHGTTILVHLEEAAIVEMLTKHMRWWKYYVRDGSLRRIAAPKEIAKTLIARRGNWPFPQLIAISSTPTLRADGTILETPGFDYNTGIFLAFRPGDWPAVPVSPSKEDAKRALELLEKPLRGFPFVDGRDKSAAIAMILTAVIRASLPSAPIFAITAPTPGTGKSKLADLAASVATGAIAAVIVACRDESEFEKRLGAALFAGDPFVNFDNLEHPLKSEFLCQVLTQSQVKPRVLGKSEVPPTSTAVTFAATGNSLTLAGDLTRRAVLVRLDSGIERPEERDFEFDPVKEAMASRKELVIAALTILRAHHLSKEPRKRPAIGSFEEWSDQVRSALLWLGCEDPWSNNSQLRDADPIREEATRIVHALPEEPFTVLGLARKLNDCDGGLSDMLASYIKGGKLETRRFGSYLSKIRDRPFDGKKVVKLGVDAAAHTTLWRIELTEAYAGTPDLPDQK